MERKIFLKPPHYFFFCLILSAAFYSFFPSFNLIEYPWTLIGLVFFIKGGAWVLIAWKAFRKHKTTRSFEKSSYLVKDSLYRYSRNPMYLGAITILLGISVFSGNLISLVSALLFFLIINFMFIPFEEEKAEREFGLEYLEYKKKVRRWL